MLSFKLAGNPKSVSQEFSQKDCAVSVEGDHRTNWIIHLTLYFRGGRIHDIEPLSALQGSRDQVLSFPDVFSNLFILRLVGVAEEIWNFLFIKVLLQYD